MKHDVQHEHSTGLNSWRSSVMSKGGKIMMEKPTETANPSKWELTDSRLTPADPVLD